MQCAFSYHPIVDKTTEHSQSCSPCSGNDDVIRFFGYLGPTKRCLSDGHETIKLTLD